MTGKTKSVVKNIEAPSIRWLIWLYFILLMFEGVLRKWMFPSFSDPLLLVRDPVLVAIYAIAMSKGIFPFNNYTIGLLIIGVVSVFIGMTIGSRNLLVTAYGFDSMFFHLPLIFIVPKAMNKSHVEKIGLCVLLLAIPMAILMVVQFRSSPDALINCGVSGSIGTQIRGAMGKIRPPGFFTFITGAAQFLAFATVFMIYGLWKKHTYFWAILVAAGLSITVSAVVSTSRLALGAVGTVFVMVGVVVLYDRKSISRILGTLVPIGLILVVATNLDIFHEGRQVFEIRLQEAGDKGGGMLGTATNWTTRAFGDLSGGIIAIQEAPFFGAGLGVGTNVGARVLSGQFGYLLAEGEWARVVLELGPLLAIPYLIIRILICAALFQTSAQSARGGNALPMLIFGSCALLLLVGQFSQTSTLGFAVLQAGLCFAAQNEQKRENNFNSYENEELAMNRKNMVMQRGCSAYAMKLRKNMERDIDNGNLF